MTPDEVRAALPPRGLPTATLLVGPGAWGLARQIRAEREVPGTETAELTLEAARALREDAHTMPLRGDEKALVANLDGAGESALAVLLRVLEEPPRAARFILAATGYPPDVIAGRCCRFVLSGIRGQALAAMEPQVRAAVAAAIRAARARQAGGGMPRDWSPQHDQALRTWSAEHASGRFRVFAPDFAQGVTRRQAMTVLTEMAARTGAKGAAAVALQAAFR